MKDWWTGRTTLTECERQRIFGQCLPIKEEETNTGFFSRWFLVFFVAALIFTGA